jgi:hypothetical protein
MIIADLTEFYMRLRKSMQHMANSEGKFKNVITPNLKSYLWRCVWRLSDIYSSQVND